MTWVPDDVEAGDRQTTPTLSAFQRNLAVEKPERIYAHDQSLPWKVRLTGRLDSLPYIMESMVREKHPLHPDQESLLNAWAF